MIAEIKNVNDLNELALDERVICKWKACGGSLNTPRSTTVPGLGHKGSSRQNLQTLTNCLHLSLLFVPQRFVIAEDL